MLVPNLQKKPCLAFDCTRVITLLILDTAQGGIKQYETQQFMSLKEGYDIKFLEQQKE
jgi:hypothetical protein